MAGSNASSSGSASGGNQPVWLLYTAAVLAGVLMLADGFNVTTLARIPAKLGIAMVFSAMALLFDSGKSIGIIATVLIWAAVVVTFLY